MTIERRFFSNAELRANTDTFSVAGYAATFNTKSHNLGGFREVLRKGCFTSALRSDGSVVCLQNHDKNLVLGSTANSTLDLEEDDRGLKFRCMLPDTQTGRDLHTLVKRGYMAECSFAFTVDRDGQDWSECKDPDDPQCNSLRTITKVKSLFDVSVVTQGAYPNTQIGARHLAMFPNGMPEEIKDQMKKDMTEEERQFWQMVFDRYLQD